MKVEFVYPNITGHQSFQQGLAYLTTSLRREGHEVNLTDFTWGEKPANLLAEIGKRKPDMIGINSLTGMMPFALNFAKEIKKVVSVPIVFGGIHPTIKPDPTLNQDCIDYICVGEGEEPFTKLVNAIEKNEKYPNVPGIWFKKDGQIVKTGSPQLNQDLDSFGIPDFSIFDTKKYINATNGKFSIIMGRGCPYPCTYCVNHTFRRILNKGSMKGYIRKNSVNFSISMIEHLMSKYNGIKHFCFEDDLFPIDKEWLFDFLKKYKSLNTGSSFSCTNRVEMNNKEVSIALKDAGCTSVSMGIESGNEELRRNVLKRMMSNKNIIEACATAKEVGIPVTTFNILGIPGETRATIRELIEINRKVQPEQLAVSIFCPYPGTELFDIALKEGMIKEDFQVPVHYRMLSEMKHPNLSSFELGFYKKSFRFLVYYKTDLKRALWYLLQDMLYGVFSKIRSRIPVSVVRALYGIQDRFTNEKAD